MSPVTHVMDETTKAPVGGSSDGQAVEQTAPITEAIENGQGTQTEEASLSSEQQTEVPFEERWNGFITKKGWNAENAQQQLLDSYQSLESKLGNWSEVEDKAGRFDSLYETASEWYQKAKLWDDAQARLEELEQTNQIQSGDLDLNQVPTDTLVQMWKSGRLDLAQIPPQRQWEVQKQAIAEEQALETQTRDEAQRLAEEHPFLKNPKVANLVADYIDRGMDPQQAIQEVKSLFGEFEKRGEERVKQDIERLKNGNLERTSSAAATKPNRIIKSVRDAYLAAKEEYEQI